MVRQSHGCWFYLPGRARYGSFTMKGRHMGAHRAAFILYRGDIPAGLQVCHTCDEPRCVNPDHLWLGTRADNMRDATAKGRSIEPPHVPGERHGLARLTAAEVTEARQRRRAGWNRRDLANAYGVAFSTMVKALRGDTWKHLDEPPVQTARRIYAREGTRP